MCLQSKIVSALLIPGSKDNMQMEMKKMTENQTQTQMEPSAKAVSASTICADSGNLCPSLRTPRLYMSIFESRKKTLSNSRLSATSTSSISVNKSDDYSSSNADATEVLKPRSDEPNLYDFPSALSPTYRTIPTILKVIISTSSLLTSFFIQKQNIINTRQKKLTFFKLVATTLITALTATVTIQETFFSPSRIDTPTLFQRGWLPSTLSKYEVLADVTTDYNSHHFQDSSDSGFNFGQSFGIHYLKYENKQSKVEEEGNNQSVSDNLDNFHNKKFAFDAVHFHHGFGASSLSWLPIIPTLVDRINARVGLAHDAPGFGFTDRPAALKGRRSDLIPYSANGSAALGNHLIAIENELDVAAGGVKNGTDKDTSIKSVALFGHSMGCAVTLRMALMLPRSTKKEIILVSPALIGPLPIALTEQKNDKSGNGRKGLASKINSAISGVIHFHPFQLRVWLNLFIASLRRVVLDAPLGYFLKRLVAASNFWSNALKTVWGDPESLSESDALRFQWPAIGLGWEKGLLAFTRSRIFSIGSFPGGEIELLRCVLELPNTSITIIHGTKDRIIPLRISRKITNSLPGILFIPLEGQGHDPFEEQVVPFVKLVESILAKERKN